MPIRCPPPALLACCGALLAAPPAVAADPSDALVLRWSDAPTIAGPVDAAPPAYRGSFFGGALAVQARTLLGEPIPLGPRGTVADAAAAYRRVWRGAELRGQSNALAQHQLSLGLQALNAAPIDVLPDAAQPLGAAQVEAPLRFGLRANDEWRIATGLAATADLRVERGDDGDARSRSHASLVWQLDAETVVKALVVRSVGYADGDTSALALPRLAGEQSDTVELAADHRLGSTLRLRGAAYQRRLQGSITLDDRLASLAVPAPALAQGLELAAEMTWDRGVRIGGGLTLQQGQGADDQDLDLVPALLGRLSLSVPLAVWNIGYVLHFAGQRANADGEALGAQALSMIELRSDRLSTGLDVALSVRNLFDQRAASAGAETVNGRAVVVNARWQF